MTAGTPKARYASTYSTAKASARWVAGIRGARDPTTPKNAVPKPMPVTEAAIRYAGSEPIASASSESPVPAASAAVPKITIVRAVRRRIANAVTAPTPASRATARPCQRCAVPPSSPRTIVAPRERNSPPVAQPAMTAGAARQNSARMSAGTESRKRNDAQAPGRRGAVSGVTTTSAASTRYTTASGMNTSPSASDVASSASAAISAPAARPIPGLSAFQSAAVAGRAGGARSRTVAESDAMSSPLATPCRIRASTSSTTDPAFPNSSMLAASSTSPTAITGRRPM